MTVALKTKIYEEVELPAVLANEILDGFSVRMFKVPSDTPGESYYVQAVKTAKDPWDRAVLLCNCWNAQMKMALALMGEKNVCKHSQRLREALRVS